MNRRVSKAAVALLTLALVLQAPAALAAQRSQDEPSTFGISRIVHVVKKIVRSLAPSLNDDNGGGNGAVPGPPKP